MRRLRQAAIAVLLAALAAAAVGCAGFGAPPAPSQAEREAYDKASHAEPAKRRQALEHFAAAWPDGALAPKARLELGELSYDAGDVDEALRQWDLAIRSGSRSPAVDTARVRSAAAAWDRGDAQAARSVLSRARFEKLSPSDRRTAYRILADVAEDAVARVRWLALERGETRDETALNEIDTSIDSTLAGMSRSDLARLSRDLAQGPLAARIWLARAERALDDQAFDEAHDALEQVAHLPLEPRYAARLSAAVERLRIRTEGPSDVSELPTFADVANRPLPVTAGAKGTLGVVLPLSGPFAHFGEESLYGVLMAAGVFGADPAAAKGSGEAMRVLVRDTGGQPDRAEAAVRELARDPSVVAIVGPLLSDECEAAAAAAEDAGIPLLALTAHEDIAHLRSFVFRVRTRPLEETQLLVDRARSLGIDRFAILYRDDPYGRGMRALFWDSVEAHGGTVVGVASYQPDATDFAGPIRQLVGYTLLSDEQKQLIAKRKKMLERARRLPPDEARALRHDARSLVTADGKPLPPIVDFGALFIADTWEKAVLIAPQLAFHEVFGPRLLGPDGWYSDQLVKVGGENVEGAIFVSDYFPESPTRFVHDFAEHYLATYHHDSNLFSAQAYDAANLVLVQLARGMRSRSALRDGVLATESYPGVSGVLTMRADGNANKRPFLLSVEKGQIVQLD